MAGDFVTINPAAVRRLREKASREMVAKITYKTAAIAKITAPGTMKQHIRVTVSPMAGGLGIVISDHPATHFVLHGTKPHVIVARNKKMLRFVVSGKVVYARMVHHPGTKANNFLMKAMLASRTL
jgi:hypothetical protein